MYKILGSLVAVLRFNTFDSTFEHVLGLIFKKIWNHPVQNQTWPPPYERKLMGGISTKITRPDWLSELRD